MINPLQSRPSVCPVPRPGIDMPTPKPHRNYLRWSSERWRNFFKATQPSRERAESKILIQDIKYSATQVGYQYLVWPPKGKKT